MQRSSFLVRRHLSKPQIFQQSVKRNGITGYQNVFSRRGLFSKPPQDSEHSYSENGPQTKNQIWEELKARKHQEFWSDANRPYRWAYLIIAAVVINVSVKYYRKKSTDPSAHPIFDDPKFTNFTLIARESISPTSFILTLRPNELIANPARNSNDPYEKEWEHGMWSVELKQPELQIARLYTPLPPDASTKPGDLRFLIRKEKGGEVSNYLAMLPPRSTVELRGPHPGVELPEKITDVLFLAGGTGIAPALQLAYTLLEKRESSTEAPLPQIRIVWANRKRDDCLGGSNVDYRKGSKPVAKMVQEIQDLQRKYPENLLVHYLVDEEGSFIDQKKLSAYTKNTSAVKPTALSSRVDTRLLFISGPDGFVGSIAGPKVWDKGEETQGDVRGLLGKMGLRDWKIWKL